MPEIKNNFTGGKMNKDLDERLMPKGQYRDAMNVEVSTSEGSNVGTLQNILGNTRVDVTDTFTGVPSGFKCVGSIADEKSNKLYWFVSSYEKDAILEYNPQTKETIPVFVDLNAWNSKAALKFAGEIITGINIIDDLLLWTDNDSEPKKINIEECKKGTVDFNSHTQLEFERGSFNGMTLELLSPSDSANTFDFAISKPKKGLYFWYEKKQLEKLLQQDIVDGLVTNIRHYRNGEYIGLKQVRIFDNHRGMHVRLSYRISDGGWDPDNIATEIGQIPAEEDWHEGDIIFGENITLDMEERHITVIKPKPLKAPAVKINHTQPSENTNNIPNLFETTFPRFSYRYKYRDGEFSTFAPFTEPVFNPKFPKDTNTTSTGNVFYNKDNAYTTEEPYNKAMENSIHSIELTDFITEQTPEDVVEIDILYKQENSSIIYSVGTIRHADSAWHASSNHEGLGHDLGIGETGTTFGYAATGSYNKGKYTVTTENIYAALPENQLLRPWDNVPRRALAQEVTGNRVVYGNYLQNYDIGLLKPEVQVAYSDRNSLIGSFTTQGLPSVKSQRNYQVGVVYCDKYGRETPVFTSDKGAINIPWEKNDGLKNASRNLQLNPSVATNFPEWVDSLKFFVKETSNPYYNLAMERAWVSKATYELDNEDGHLWISFPSSDRNKITEEDYIVLKKKIGVGEEQVDFENKFKVIDIANEAPDAIKYRLVNYGTVSNTDSNAAAVSQQRVDALFDNNNERIDVETDTIRIDKSEWEDNFSTPLEQGMGVNTTIFDPKDLYISWRKLGTGSGLGVSSKKYRITGGTISASDYIMKLSTPITRIDADIAHLNGDSSTGNSSLDLHDDLVVQIERKELKDDENFSGSFFVKISKNQVTNFIEEGSDVNIKDNYIVSAKNKSWYWRDNIASVTDITISSATGYGLFNYNGFVSTITSFDSIQHTPNNSIGDVAGDTNSNGGFIGVTDYAAAWDGILGVYEPTFFIDGMHMVAGQSEASDYAKYCCVTWAGSTKVGAENTSGWSYPPLKTWLTDFIDSENYNPNQEIEVPGVGVTGKFHTALKNAVIDISPLVAENDEYKFYDTDTSGQRVTGWVGQEQSVKRLLSLGNTIFENHVNGLEGIVTTTEDHSTGPRRWFSGITGNPTDQGVGVDTNTYANDDDDIGRHFMHLSFFAPGRDLVPDTFPGTFTLFGNDSVGNNLQGIWGGGHFTGTKNNDTFGVGGNTTLQHRSLCLEGNNDLNDGAWLPETPGPGVGFGYDLDYRDLHERQWDPTFNSQTDPENKIRDFIRNLHAGAQFKFSTDPNDEIYTIKKVVVKKLYNHTSWRKPYNRYNVNNSIVGSPNGGYDIDRAYQDDVYISVEEAAIEWLDTLDDNGGGGDADKETLLKNKIKAFGRASNRRLCYIIELDKNPTDQTHNPLASAISADHQASDFANIEFVEQVQSVLLSELNKFPAIWEISPKKQQVDLDIYYEASNNIPVKLNSTTNELFAPIGCRVEILDGPVSGSSRLKEWKDGATAIFEPGFPLLAVPGSLEADYSGSSFKFIREDGSFTIAQAEEQVLSGDVNTVGHKTEFLFREDIGDNVRVGLPYYNCFSFNNGLESNRIKDDFNEMYIGNGVKASSTTQKTYEEERRSHGLIYSGLYNSSSGINDLNQFIMAEKITKDLNPTYGSIQKLFQRRISLIAFCEDRVVSITSNKDALYNADGNPQLVSTNLVLGDVNPFVGDYGISKNPESFASESYRAYFTDKQRGAVLRLSKDGLTPISDAGMHDWFRDNLLNYSALIGTYDSYKQNYNISLSHAFGENIIYNTYFDLGQESTSQLKTLLNYVANPTVTSGTNLQYGYERKNVLNDSEFVWGPQNRDLNADVVVTMHPAIATGELQEYVPPRAPVAEVLTNLPTLLGGYTGSGSQITGTTAADLITVNGQLGAYTVPDNAATILANDVYDYNGNIISSVSGFVTDPNNPNAVGAYTVAAVDASVSDVIIQQNQQNFNTLNSVGGSVTGGNPETDLQITGYTAVTSATQTSATQVTTTPYDEVGAVATPFETAQWDNYPNNPVGTDILKTVAISSYSGNIWGQGITSTSDNYLDPNVYSVPRRIISGVTINENQINSLNNGSSQFPLDYANNYDPSVEKGYGNNNGYPAQSANHLNQFSQAITRSSVSKNIVFDRAPHANTYLEFRAIGHDGASHFDDYITDIGYDNVTYANWEVAYAANPANTPMPVRHRSVFNGQEIHVQVRLKVYQSGLGYNQIGGYFSGHNNVKPRIQLLDGVGGIIPNNKFCSPTLGHSSNPITGTLSDEQRLYEKDNSFPNNGLSEVANDPGTFNKWEWDGLQLGNGNVGSTVNCNCKDIRRYQSNSAVAFSSTGDYIGYTETNSVNTSLPWHNTTVGFSGGSSVNMNNVPHMFDQTAIVTVGARWKFRDPVQQNGDGSPKAGITNIIEKQVVNDLIIRISNGAPVASDPTHYNYNNSWGEKPLRNALWEVERVHVTSLYEPYRASRTETLQGYIDYTGPTLYENFTAYQPPSQFVTYIPVSGFEQYIPPEPEITEIKEVEAVPPFPVPAWAEVQHQTFGWTMQGHGNYTNSYFSNLGTNPGQYGPSFGGMQIIGKKAAPDPADLPSNHPDTTYTVPNNWEYNSWNQDNTVSGASGNPSGNFNWPYVSGDDNNPNTYTIDQHLFVHTPLDSNGDKSAVYIKFDITADSWVAGDWYLVDLEFDETYDGGGGLGVAGTGGDNGSCHITHIASQNWNGTVGIDIHPEGVGRYSGKASLVPKHSHVMLLPRVRNEYGNTDGSGDGKNVIRAIFQAAPDSLRLDNNINTPTENGNQFELYLYNFINSAKLETVIVKKLDYGLTEGVIGGSAFSWEHTVDILTHSFTKRKIYWKDNKLCWDVTQGNDYNWLQRFGNPTYQVPSYPPPHPGEYGWILKFTVGPNPDTGTFSGDGLRGYVNNNETNLGPLGTSYDGLYFSDIQDEGDYEIFFTTNGDETDWYIHHDNGGGGGFVPYATGNIESTATMNSGTPPASLANMIMFSAGDTTSALSDLTCSISNISLKDQTLIFQGGSAGSWNFDGWDNSIAPYIIWNSNSGVNGLIEFNDCPLVDPNSGSILTTFLNANQFVDRNIDRFERFEIEFNHGITEGMLKIYYFNSEGYGFRIPDIGPSTPSLYKTTVEVGDEIWDWENPEGPNYAPELKETFVIQVDNTYMLANPSESVNGWIDSIRMTRVYNIEEDENGETILDEKTVTFSEAVNGWTSFKSFVPESGVSLSKKYFTIDSGGLFQHYVPLKKYYPTDGGASYFVSSSSDDAENYNMFYGIYSEKGSSVRVILNNEPSTVKTFKTLNYEGTQAQVLRPSSIGNITINNAAAWQAGGNIQGWFCSDVKTNLDMGSVKQFIEKEGKWFNYIKGKDTLNAVTGDAVLDTSLFSVQGIGESSEIFVAPGVNVIF
tara:strand:- start:13921 stop:24210 length:10290 start_codon:yes stop_codon:yes gene_type:complete